MEKKKEQKSEVILLRLTKEQKEKVFNIVEKSSYASASELIRAGIDKEINIQIGVRIDIWTHLMRGCIIELCTLH